MKLEKKFMFISSANDGGHLMRICAFAGHRLGKVPRNATRRTVAIYF